MKRWDNVKVISIDIYTNNNVSPLVNIGDIGQFIGYQDKDRETCIVKINNGFRLLPINHLEIV